MTDTQTDLKLAAIILAAGQGTRMKSDIAKVLHPVGGRPMVLRAVETAERLYVALRVASMRPVVVIGRDADSVCAAVGDRAEYVVQGELLGTGHAVMQAEAALRGVADLVVVYYADMPLIRHETLLRIIEAQRANSGPITMLTIRQSDPRGFGRIVRGADGNVAAIVEEKECTPEQLAIRELNPGVYAFSSAWLWENLKQIRPKSKGEYYLTDLIEIAVAQGQTVRGIEGDDPDEGIGINTRVHLSEAEAALRKRINHRWMMDGVTILDPATTYIQEDVIIGQDTVILPNTHLQGQTVIGPHCTIGPNSIVCDSKIGAYCVVDNSVIEGAVLEDRVDIGPFSHLRKGAYLEQGVHIGNFGEVKNSRLGRDTRMGHFSYVGDATVGQDVNIGAGTITANFDGVRKNKTVIGDHVFIGSDTMLIAPVTVESGARTAAGAVVTHDVPTGHIAIGVPARLREIRPPEE